MELHLGAVSVPPRSALLPARRCRLRHATMVAAIAGEEDDGAVKSNKPTMTLLLVFTDRTSGCLK
ncbi:hypothetical protein E2562_001784 [Oryza meyeriana var. granulata]|uniref:Uncharacterized protein n=1 Tax=Oryza meyeriana var. granulata TaxID=110450 RepID=A0A6G1CDA9_9ORYZ|nr:hypothetical protein E2562_001784 [Oryza meyeriana var. granulata]